MVAKCSDETELVELASLHTCLLGHLLSGKSETAWAVSSWGSPIHAVILPAPDCTSQDMKSLLLQPHIAAPLELTLLGAEAEQDSVDLELCSQAQGR